MHYGGIEKNISSILEGAVKEAFAALNISPPSNHQLRADLEIPKDRSHGDLSSAIAMKLSKFARRQPMELADLIKSKFDLALASFGLSALIRGVEASEPGFINFFFSIDHLTKSLLEIKRSKANFGRSSTGRGTKLQIEFVSANPTGPLTIAHGRQAAIGDSLANILEFLGYTVTREYYLNDEGTQMDMLGASVRARYMELFGFEESLPADGYKGSYVIDIAKAFKARYGKKFLKTKNIDIFREFGLRQILARIKKDLSSFGVKFDVWYSQKMLRKKGLVKKAIGLLAKKGYVYEKDEATWFRSTAFGDEKDRVIVRSDASYTYLAPDIAYHLEKYKRGFRRIIDIWGPDHHGYMPRMKAAVEALGFPKDSISILIVQLATLYRGGRVLSMSTRAGEFVRLGEVMDEVGKDAARFCFLMRRISSHLDFDLDIVKSQSMENPVYYIQYAHARIWSLLEYGRPSLLRAARFDSRLLREEEELQLLRILRQFPMVVLSSGKALEPYVILQYLQDVAAIFHSFYNRHRVVSDDRSLTKTRLVLVDCVRIVLANGLRLLGVSLPKKM